MPLVSDLMGLGMPAALATRLGNTPQTIAGAGATGGAATAIPVGQHITLFTAASTTANGIIFATNAAVGTPQYVAVLSSSPTTGTIYCPVSGSMNGTSNGSVVLTTGKTAIFIQTSQSVWISFPLTP